MDDKSRDFLIKRWESGDYQKIASLIQNEACVDKWAELCQEVASRLDKGMILDLQGIDLSQRTFSEGDFGSCCLDYANLSHAQFNETWFAHSRLVEASFAESILSNLPMIPLDAERTKFTKAKLYRASLQWSKIVSCDFTDAKISESSFDNSDMTGCKLVRVYAEKSGFNIKCKLTHADLTSAKFVECNFSLADLSGSNLDACVFENCDLSGTDFTGIQLRDTRFVGGTFGIVDNAGNLCPTKFDDTPQNRALIANSPIDGKDSIEWRPVQEASYASPMADATIPTAKKLRGLPNQTVPQTGWWISPAFPGEQGRRYFEAGQKFPETATTSWGAVIWQYSPEEQ